MANQRTTFLKRQREMDRNDKAKAKEARLAAARSEAKSTAKGPQIAWDEAVTEYDSALESDAPPATGGNLSSPNANSNNTANGNNTAPQKPAAPAVPAKPAPGKPPVKP